MESSNLIYEFRYVDKKRKVSKTIYALSEEKANYIINFYNNYSIYNYVPKRFGFKKEVYVSMLPVDLENQEIDTAEQLMNSRKGQN